MIHPVFGELSEFAPGSLADLQLLICGGNPLVTVRSDGRDYDATIVTKPADTCLYALRVVLPRNVPTGPAEIRVTSRFQEASKPITILPLRFGFLDWPPLTGNDTAVRLTQPALAGSTVRLRGTGLGLTPNSALRATLGTQALEVAAVSDVEPGVDELRFRLPDTIAFPGCYLPLVLTAVGDVAPAVHLPVAQTAGPCQHPLGLTRDQLTVLDEGRSLAVGVADSDWFTAEPSETLFGAYFPSIDAPLFRPANAKELEGMLAPQIPGTRYGCRIVRNPDYYPFTLDAGGTVLTDPAGRQWELPGAPEGALAGKWGLRVAGGRDVEPVTTSFTLPTTPRLLNFQPEITYGASQEIRVEWSPADYESGHEMTITLTATEPRYTILECITAARDGFRLIPLGALVLASGQTKSSWNAFLRLSVSPRPGAQTFRFRLSNGIESVGYVRYGSSVRREVQFREVQP